MKFVPHLTLRAKIRSFIFGFSILSTIGISLLAYFNLERQIMNDLRETLTILTSLGADSLDKNDITILYKKIIPDYTGGSTKPFTDAGYELLADDEIRIIEQGLAYGSIERKLQEIRSMATDLVHYVYILMPTTDPTKARFLVDADVLRDRIEQSKNPDYNEHISSFSSIYDISDQPTAIKALQEKIAIVDTMFRYDAEYDTNSLMSFAPIFDAKGNYLATLGIDVADSRIYNILNGSKLLFLIMISIVIIISFFVSQLMSQYFTKPIGALASVVKKFTEKDFTARAPVSNNHDEISVLSSNVNLMAEEIQKFSKHLEDIVKIRTHELTDAYNALQLRTEDVTKDLKMAQRVQQKIIPSIPDMPQRDEFKYGAYYRAMANVGGDIYDVIRIGKNAFGFLIADVSGHGIPAALITAMVKVAFQSKASWGVDTKDICTQVNNDLFKIMSDMDHYVTAFYGILNLETGIMQYTNCGHHAGLLIRNTGEIIKLDTEGVFLGIFEDAVYESKQINIMAEDRLFLFTDGIIEARNLIKEEYEYERLFEFIEKNRTLGAKEFVEKLVKDIEFFSMGAKPNDDQTILYIEINPKESYIDIDIENTISIPKKEVKTEPIESIGKTNARDFMPKYQEATNFVKNGEYDKAESILIELLKTDETNPKVLNNLGIVYFRTGRLFDALTLFETAIAHDETNERLKKNLLMVKNTIEHGRAENV